MKYTYYKVGRDDELYHYGVPGMRWGVHRALGERALRRSNVRGYLTGRQLEKARKANAAASANPNDRKLQKKAYKERQKYYKRAEKYIDKGHKLYKKYGDVLPPAPAGSMGNAKTVATIAKLDKMDYKLRKKTGGRITSHSTINKDGTVNTSYKIRR